MGQIEDTNSKNYCGYRTMTSPKLSIIVPIYNSELTIEKCLNSIKNQLFSDFECIVINDGSEDFTYQICKKVAEGDKRFQILNNRSNMGVSYCRNLGINKARGELIGWVDSDDYIDPSHFERLCSPMIQNDPLLDISMCNVSIEVHGEQVGIFDVAKSIEQYDPNVRESFITSSCYALLALCEDVDCKSWLPNKVFRKQLFNGVSFSTQQNILEDFDVMHRLFYSAKKIYLTNSATYHNEQTEASLSRNYSSQELWKWLIPATNRYFFVKPMSKFAALLALQTYLRFYNNALSASLNENQKSIPTFIKPILRKMTPDVLLSSLWPIKSKIKYLLLISPFAFIFYSLKGKL